MTVRSAFWNRLFWGIFSTFLIFSSNLSAQIPSHWYLNQEEGLPTNTVYKILQDRNNITWIGTSSGIVKYNSIQFTYYNNDTLRDKEFITLSLDSLNRVWVTNTSKQIAYIDHDQLKVFRYHPIMDNINHINLQFDKDYLYLTIIYLKKQKRKKPVNYSSIYKIPIQEVSKEISLRQYLIQSVKDTLLKPTIIGGELILLEGTKRQYQFTSTKNKIHIPSEVQSQLRKWDNNHIRFRSLGAGYYIVFGDEKIILWDQNGEVVIKSLAHTIHDVNKINDRLWILTASGLSFLDLKNTARAPYSIFPETAFSSMIKDREGNIWLGTLDRGIIMIPSIDFEIVSCDKSPFFSLFALPKGEGILAGGKNKLLLIQKDHAVTSLPLPKNVGRILSIYARGKIIVFAADNGAYWRGGEQKEFISIPYSKASKAVLIDSKFGVWIGRYNRLSYYENELDEDNAIYFLRKRTISLEEDFRHQVWAGTTEDVNIIQTQGDFFRQKADTLPLFVNSIKRAEDSTLYLATCNAGVLQYSQEGIQIKKLPLGSEDCFNSILCDKNSVWIGGNKGLTYFNTKNNQLLHIYHYHGLPSNEINDITRQNDLIWVATSKGLVKFSKDFVNLPISPTNIALQKIEVNNKTIPFDKETTALSSAQNNLKITFEAINYSLRGDLQFKYRLLPDTQWQISKSPFALFPNQKPGQYKFEVGLNNEVATGPLPSFSFTIRKPWWQHSWLYFLATGIAMFITWRTIAAKQKKTLQKIAKEQQIQQRIADLKITALQSQMNPHFIFNCLNTIQAFIVNDQQQLATKTLGQFSQLIRKVFEYSDYKIIRLDDELDFLKTYLKLEQLRFDEDLSVELVCSNFVKEHAFELAIPPLLVQPIVENAFAHGLLHQSGEKKLVIIFEKIDNYLKCSVIDNGVGMDQSAKFNLDTHNKRTISGLQLTRDRIAIFNCSSNSNKNKKNFIITDLKEATNGRETGTKVEFFIVINHEY